MTHPKKLPTNEQIRRLVKCVADWSELNAISGEAVSMDKARQQMAHFVFCHLEELGIAPHHQPEGLTWLPAGLLEDADAFFARN